MISKTLQHLINEQHTSAREISELTGVSTSTVYRWIADESQPDFNSMRLLLRHLPTRAGQEALLTAFAGGTAWQFVQHECELDVDDDGDVDADDALDAAIHATKAATRSLEQVREAGRDERFSSDETLRVVSTLNHAIGQCTLTQRILVEVSERQQKRKLKLAR